jgi:hypothetical protein
MATIKKPPNADDHLETYEEELQILVAEALSGRIKKGKFKREMLKLSTDSTLIMFLIGEGNPENKNAKKWLAKQKAIHRKSIKQLADDIYNGRYSDEVEDG